MKKITIIILLIALTSGCASVKQFLGFSSGKTQSPSSTVSKREAIRLARDYLQNNGFHDEFNLRKPGKISKKLSLENEPRWVWRVYFPSRSRKFWKFWKRSPIMVELYADTGQVRSWGRR